MLRLALPACLVAGLAGPARASFMIPGSPVRPKDFALVKKDGTFHLFYIQTNVVYPPSLTENAFGHAVSTDLYHWTQEPSVLAVGAGTWDNLHVWAPTIVQRDSLYWMFYCGVSNVAGHYNQTQRIGVAVSSDLVNWTRWPAPVFSPAMTTWAWSDTASAGPSCRDPFVMPDPDQPGDWLMYYTVALASDTTSTLVGVARSHGDFTQWTDAGPLWVTWRNFSFNTSNESPHLFAHGGLWYLFVTTSAGQPLTFMTAPDPMAAPAAWWLRGRVGTMIGVDTSPWYASEYLRDGSHELFAFVNTDRIDLRELQWTTGGQFDFVQPPYFHVVAMDWGAHAARAGDTLAFVVDAANPLAGPPRFQTWLVDSNGNETAAPPESLGFAATPALGAATPDTLWWIARRWPRVPNTDTLTVTRLRVRMADSTAASGVLTVRSGYASTSSGGDGGVSIGDQGVDEREKHRDPVFLSVLQATPGAPPELAVSLLARGRAQLDVFDVRGRRVRGLVARDLPAGRTMVAWDGRDDAGVHLPHGVYFARLEAAGRVRAARVLLLGE